VRTNSKLDNRANDCYNVIKFMKPKLFDQDKTPTNKSVIDIYRASADRHLTEDEKSVFGNAKGKRDYELLRHGGLRAFNHFNPHERPSQIRLAIQREVFGNQMQREFELGAIATMTAGEVVPLIQRRESVQLIEVSEAVVA
jgi:hypothetical protein